MASGLPHFKNSTASVKNYEPVFLNQFQVIITPPATVSAGSEILVEHVLKIEGLPEITPVGVVEQKYKFSTRSYAKSKPENTTADLKINFTVNLNDNNSMYVYNILRKWADIQFDPETGSQGLKKDYAGECYIAIHNKNGDIFREFKFSPVILNEKFNPMALDYNSEELYALDLSLRADSWTEIRKP